ncbi:MAG: AAA family ATPase [Caldilineaceae bacterium]
MIVEFIGSTGAGKTTLIQHLLATCQRTGVRAMVGTDFVLQQSRLHGIKHQLLRTILINLLALLAALSAWRHNRQLYQFVMRTIRQQPDPAPWREKLVLAKNIFKRIGIYELIRRHGSEQHVYLVDEGTLHVAHSLFVQVSAAANPHELAAFVRLVPLPHVVVYLQQAEAVLIERTLARGHRRIPDHSLASVAYFIRQAVQVFDTLVREPAIAGRLLVVDGAQQLVTTPGYGNEPALRNISQLVQAGLQAAVEPHPASVRLPA